MKFYSGRELAARRSFVAAAVVLSAGWLFGGTYYVDDDWYGKGGTGTEAAPYGTIQEAVEAVPDGSTVLVKPGVYDQGVKSWGSAGQKGRVFISKALTLKSTEGREVTHIVGVVGGGESAGKTATQGETLCIYVSCRSAVRIEGFTLRDGTAVANSGAAGGISGATGATTNEFLLAYCTVSNCYGKVAGMWNGAAVGTLFSDCHAGDYGSVRAASLYNCVIANARSGASLNATAQECTLANCTIVNNFVNQSPTKACTACNTVVYGNKLGFGDGSGVYTSCVVDGTSYASGSASVTEISRSAMYENLLMSPVTGDCRPIAGGSLDATGSKSAIDALEFIPPELVSRDFDGEEISTSANPPIGALFAAATPATVGVASSINLTFKFNGRPAAYGYAVHYADAYPAPVYLEPTDDMTNSLAAISINSYGSLNSQLHHWLGVQDGVWIVPPSAGAMSGGTALGPVPVYGQSVTYHYYADSNLADYSAADGKGWSTAFETIQEAVDAAVASGKGCWIHVRAGTYSKGGKIDTSVVDGYARVAVNAGSTVMLISSEGDVGGTVIEGAKGSGSYGSGDGAYRCLALRGSKIGVCGFTLRKGGCSGSSNTYGGGVYCYDSNAVVADCVISDCSGYQTGGAYSGTLLRCRIENCYSRVCPSRNGVRIACVYRNNYNNPIFCHGAYTSEVCVNCTFYDPNATSDTFVNNGNTSMRNCLIVAGGNLQASTETMVGNLADSSGLKAHGEFAETEVKFADALVVDAAGGNLRPLADSPAIGCGVLTCSASSPEWMSRYVGFDIDGNCIVDADGQVTAGAYVPRARIVCYVDSSRADDSGDGLSEATAKKTLKGAVEAYSYAAGDEVVALPGTYASESMLHTAALVSGGSTPTLRSRVVVPANLTLRSRDGARTAFIEGEDGSGENGCGEDAKRAVTLLAGAKLVGFTVRGGRTVASSPKYTDDYIGAGVLGAGYSSATVEDCVFTNCIAASAGGGACAKFSRCRFLGNKAVYFAPGVRSAKLYNCLFVGNCGNRTAEVLYDCVNCTFVDSLNFAGNAGAATFQNMGDCENLVNTLVCGTVYTTHNSQGSTVNAKVLKNCIFPKNMGYVASGAWPASFENVNTNLTVAALVKYFDADGRPKKSFAPSVDAGLATELAGDYDVEGKARVAGNAIDIGAYEHVITGGTLLMVR